MRRKNAWLNVALALVVGANASVATLYWVEGNRTVAIVWIVSALLWSVSVWYRTSIAYYNGCNETWEKVDKLRRP